MQALVAIVGLGAGVGVYLALAGSLSTPRHTGGAGTTEGLSVSASVPRQPPPEVRLLPRRPRDHGHRLSARQATDRPWGIVGEGLPDRIIPDCPRLKSGRNKPFVYGVGSSTMGGLAKVLAGELKKYGVRTRKWAVAGSGLARPDFHDWPGEVPSVVRDYDPDVFVVVIGTNDNQAVWDEQERAWYRPNHPKWAPTYRARIRAMLANMNRKRSRWVFWVGPNLLDRRSSRRVGKRINAMMAEEVRAYGSEHGNAWYIDLYNMGRDERGRAKTYLSKPGGGDYRLRGHDGVHLLYSGLRWALAEPVLKSLRPCIRGKSLQGMVPGPRPRLEFHLEERRERRP